MYIIHNSQDEFFRKPFGAVACNTNIEIKLLVKDAVPSLKIKLCLWEGTMQMSSIPMVKQPTEDGDVYSCKIKATKDPGLMWYHFVIENYEERLYYGNNEHQFGGEGRVYESNPVSYQITVYQKDKTPTWFKEGIAYQIFPDRFNRGEDYEYRKEQVLNRDKDTDRQKYFHEDWYESPRYERNQDGSISKWDFFGGTLKGIEEKLPYLKELGVTVIYLNPIFESRSNHRYDTADYKKIDALLGDEDAFKSLIKSAKNCGIHIIIDGVFSHTGADSIYFNKNNNYENLGAYQGKESEYYDWYRFHHENRDEYECWWGVKDLPEVNELNEKYIDFICKNKDSVLNHWLNLGVSGVRLDVADELPDEFIKEIRNTTNKHKDTVLLGEVWEDASNKISYDKVREFFRGKELQSVMNYDMLDTAVAFMKGDCSPEFFVSNINRQKENYPIEYFYSNFNLLGSHDRPRILTILGDAPDEFSLSEDEKYNFGLDHDKYDLAKSRLKVMSTLEFTLPGIPTIYYGDEIGMQGFKDPYNRKAYPWGRVDEEIFEHYKKLCKIRKDNKALLKGSFDMYPLDSHGLYISRRIGDEEILVFLSRAIFYNEIINVNIDTNAHIYKDLLTDEEIEVKDGKLSFDLLPLGYKILKKIK